MEIHSHSHNFETSSILILIVTLGKFIEIFSKMKTINKLQELAELKVTKANLISEKDKNKISLNSASKEIEVELLQLYDYVLV
jgi:cation transport ATPase